MERQLSIEKKGNKYNRDKDQQFDDIIWHFPMLEEQTKQHEEDVKLSTSTNAVNVDGGEVDGESLREEDLEQINCELLDQEIAEVRLMN